ncbi:MAG: hypothetical protein JRC77_01640 [Deltaproteobacteria bacterium]|nr:hypothetical protein [Deltaproteobacteria bacterium]
MAEILTTEASSEVRKKLMRLSGAGAALRNRKMKDVAEKLGEVLERLRDPASPQCRILEKEYCQLTGSDPQMVNDAMRLALQRWSKEAWINLVETELGRLNILDDPFATPNLIGFDSSSLILGGCIPMPTMLSIIAPLMLRTPVLVKCSRHDTVTPGLVAEIIAEVDPQLGECVAVTQFSSEDKVATEAMLRAPCVVATGSNDTIKEISEFLSPRQRFVGYGFRFSIAVLESEALRTGPRIEEAARKLAVDIALWDQLGCLSPLAVYVVGPAVEHVDELAMALGEALAKAEKRWPRVKVSAEVAARIQEQRSDAEMRSAGQGRTRLIASSGTEWTVVREADATFRSAPMHRFIRIHPVESPSGLYTALKPMSPGLAAVAIPGFSSNFVELSTLLSQLGASRLCLPGRMHAPPIDWHHDNLGVLRPLARFSDIER